jgi:hypothetical protein
METFKTDSTVEETVVGIIDSVIADSALRGSMKGVSVTDGKSANNAPSSSTGSLLSMELEGYQDVEEVARANLEAALGQGLGQRRTYLTCPSCQRPVSRTELGE